MTVSSEYRGRIDEELKRLHRIADDLGTEPFLEFEDRYREGKLSEPYCLERLSRQYTFFNVSATYEPERSMELIDLAVEAWDESCIDISFTQLLDTKSYLLMDSGDYFGYRQYVLKRILSIVEPDCWDTDVSLTGLEAVIKEKRSFSAMGELCDFYRGSKRYHDQRRCLDMMEAWLEGGVESGNMHDLNLISAIDVLSKAEKDCFSHYFASIAKRTCYNLVDRNPKEYGCNGHIAFLIWKLSQYSGEYREDYLDHAIVNRDYDALEAKLNCYRYDCLDDYLKGLRFCLSSGYTPHDIIAAFNVN